MHYARAVLAFLVVSGLLFLVGCHGGGDDVAPSSSSSMVAVEPSQEELLGDLNGNGLPDVSDAIGILRIVVGLDPDNPLADCDQDGATGVADAIMVLRCVVGLAPWPIGSGGGGAIAYIGCHGDEIPLTEDIYIMAPDGRGQTQLSDLPGEKSRPVWSPDGTKIAFTSRPVSSERLTVMDADGGNQVSIDIVQRTLAPVAWSPDSSRIAYENGNQIWMMNADTTGPVQLTQAPGSHSEPAWSPDGNTIAYTRNDGESIEIYTMDADGGNQTARTEVGDARSRTPVFSPDGARIAFKNVGKYDIVWQVWVMDADGTNAAPVTDFEFGASVDAGAWSPDGNQLVVTARDLPTGHLCVLDSDGGNPLRLSTSDDGGAAWSPDGSTIAFSDGGRIYTIGADGNGLCNIGGPNLGHSPAWSATAVSPAAQR